jgi:hypothetical protein
MIKKFEYLVDDSLILSSFYTKYHIDLEALISNGINDSFILEDNGTFLLCPIIRTNELIGTGTASYLPMPFMFGEMNRKSITLIIDEYLNYLDLTNLPVFLRMDPLTNYPNESLRLLLAHGFQADISFTTLIDLSLSLEQLQKKMQRRCARYIRSMSRQFEARGFTGATDFDEFEQFLELFKKAILRGGRAYPEASYEKLRAIFKAQKLVLFAIFQDGQMVSGYTIALHNEAAYCMNSVTHQDYENKNQYTHLLLWTGMMYLKEKGIRMLEHGPVFFRNMANYQPSEKELKISSFKYSMGGDVKMVANLHYLPSRPA